MEMFDGCANGTEGAVVRDAVLAGIAALDFDPHGFEDKTLLSFAVDAEVDGAIDLAIDRASRASRVVNRHDEALARHFEALTTDERAARSHFGLPEPAPNDKPEANGSVAETLGELLEEVRGLRARLPSKEEHEIAVAGPLFSQAAEAYLDRVRTEKGDDHPEIGYLRHRIAVWTALVGDRPIGEYHGADLQDFVHKIMFLPPRVSDRPDYDISRVRDYVEEGKAAVQALANYDDADGRWPGLSEKTIRDGYAGRIKTIVTEAATGARMSSPFANFRLTVPPEVSRSEVKELPTFDQLNEVFRVAVASGNIVDTLLPLLGFLTGRRIALLSFLHTSGVTRRPATGFDASRPEDEVTRDCALAKVRGAVYADGCWRVVPVKTDQSRVSYALHSKLTDVGFVDWAISQKSPRFVFEHLMTRRDPADTASKRMGRLFREAGIDPKVTKVFHGLRSMALDTMRTNKVSPRTAQIQVGHELETVHDIYGTRHLRDDEVLEIDALRFPGRIDFSPYHNLDWDALAAAPLYRRSKRK